MRKSPAALPKGENPAKDRMIFANGET